MPNLPQVWAAGDWQSASQNYDKDDGQPGIIAPTGAGPMAASFNLTLVANRTYWVRFRPSRPMNITLMAFGLTVAAGADDPCELGIYDSAGIKLVTSGSVGGRLNGSVGAKTVPVAFAVVPQVYYAVFAVGPIGGTAAQVGATNISGATQLFGAGMGQAITGFTNAWPAPAQLTFSGAIAGCPVLALRES